MNPFPFSSYIIPAIFALAALTTITGALVAVMTTRIIRSVCGLMICCIGLAGLYYFLHSPFLALMEILIYVGAVCITIIFGVMLSEPDEPRETSRLAGALWGGTAAFVSVLVFVGLARISLQHPWPEEAVVPLNDGSVEAIGRALLTTYSLAFEMISLVLLLAILGALVIARAGRTRPSPTGPATVVEPRPPAAGSPAPGFSDPTTSKRELAETLPS
jgi:NADH:ubiquinone oxidoreductase subunit 6 (subunit J)